MKKIKLAKGYGVNEYRMYNIAHESVGWVYILHCATYDLALGYGKSRNLARIALSQDLAHKGILHIAK